LSPATIKRVIKELADLTQNPPEGIKVVPCEDDVSDIEAIVEGPAGTPYEGGIFRVKLILGSDFPASPPKGLFLTKIFHPNVSSKGEICVNTLKKDWKSDLPLKHVLLTVKCLLIVPNPESALNEEAGRLLLERYEDYAKHARLMTSIHAKKLAPASPAPKDASASDPEKKRLSKDGANKKVLEKKSLKRL